MTALGRLGLPDDIGPTIAGLVSQEDRWINGQRIEVSGGMVLQPRRRRRTTKAQPSNPAPKSARVAGSGTACVTVVSTL